VWKYKRCHGCAQQGAAVYPHSHGGNVELIDIADAVVCLRLIGSCHGWPSSTMTLKTAIETAIFENGAKAFAAVF